MRLIPGRQIYPGGNAKPLSALLAILMLTPIPVVAQKTDVVIFKNGDQLTVDIKEFTRGRMRASTIGMGTIYIEWDVIESVSTEKLYQVELSSGVRYLGTIKRAEKGKDLVVYTMDGPRNIEFTRVATITRIKRDRSFWDRIDGSVRLGVNYTSGSQVGQMNFGLNASFVEEKYIVGTDLEATLTTGSATNDTRRYNWGVQYWRLLENRWFWVANTDVNSNEELGIDYRLLAGGGAGRFLIKSNTSRWSVSGGLAASNEKQLTGAEQNQLEGQFTTDYSLYFFSPTKTDLNLNLVVYPGITETDRVRGNFDAKIRWEMIKDLTWDLTYFYTWDNKPPQGANDEDTGITTSIGYTF